MGSFDALSKLTGFTLAVDVQPFCLCMLSDSTLNRFSSFLNLHLLGLSVLIYVCILTSCPCSAHALWYSYCISLLQWSHAFKSLYMQTPLPYYDNSPWLHEENLTCPFTLSYAEHMLPWFLQVTEDYFILTRNFLLISNTFYLRLTTSFGTFPTSHLCQILVGFLQL